MLGSLFVIAAPSGAGKTSLVNELITSMNNLVLSVSYTTRPQRPMEQNGIHYWFISQAQFEEMVVDNAFLEYAKVFNHFYGTARHSVMERLEEGVDVILEIDWQGARQIKQQFPWAVTIFILPPSLELLRQRLVSRNQDNRNVIEERLAGAQEELSHFDEFDYLVVNDIFESALADLQAIVKAERLKRHKQDEKQKHLLANLLQTR